MINRPQKFENKIFMDTRGSLVDLSRQSEMFNFETVHQCFSTSLKKFTMRGLHFQFGKFAQTKILTCLTGSLTDVVVNINDRDPEFGTIKYFNLNAGDGYSLYIPSSYAHGFITAQDHTLVHYSFDNFFSYEHSTTLDFFDNSLDIEFPCEKAMLHFSESDSLGISFEQAVKVFKRDR